MWATIQVIIYLAILVAVIYGFVNSRKKRQELKDKGLIIDRTKGWVTQTTVLVTTVESVDTIYQAMDIGELNHYGIQSSHGTGSSYYFRLVSGGQVLWDANLTTLPMQGQLHQYGYSVQHWHATNGAVKGENGMNMVLTQIEKAALALDPNAQVSRKAGDYSTKRHVRFV